MMSKDATKSFSGKMNKCHRCGCEYPEEFGGIYCPKCEDLIQEGQEVAAEMAEQRAIEDGGIEYE